MLPFSGVAGKFSLRKGLFEKFLPHEIHVTFLPAARTCRYDPVWISGQARLVIAVGHPGKSKNCESLAGRYSTNTFTLAARPASSITVSVE